MTHFRIKLRELLGLSFWLLVAMSSTVVCAQSHPAGQIPHEGISSYIFSPYAITVLLVLALIVQLAYRQWSRAPKRQEHATYLAAPIEVPKKRYDRDEISKLLKASATSKNRGRTLEEAIRLSQVIQPDLAAQLEANAAVGEADEHQAESLDSHDEVVPVLMSTDAAGEEDGHVMMAAGDEYVAEVNDESVTPVGEESLAPVDLESVEAVSEGPVEAVSELRVEAISEGPVEAVSEVPVEAVSDVPDATRSVAVLAFEPEPQSVQVEDFGEMELVK